jgi:hypothetical protein
MQQIMTIVQQLLYIYGGSLNKFLADDKGTTIIGAFNLPLPQAARSQPQFFSSYSTRAVRAALDIRDELHAVGVRSSIGITTDTAFCGVVGGSNRKEYTMIGDCVNMAARLMQAASGRCLTDMTTYQEARAKCIFQHLLPITVKGKEKPIPVFAALRQQARDTPATPPAICDHSHRILTPEQAEGDLAGSGAVRKTVRTAASQTHCTLYGRSRHVQLLGQLLQDLEDDYTKESHAMHNCRQAHQHTSTHRTPHIPHPTSHIPHPTSHIPHPTSHIRHPTSDTTYIRHNIHHASCIMHHTPHARPGGGSQGGGTASRSESLPWCQSLLCGAVGARDRQ